MNHSEIWAYSIISLIDLSCESKRFFWRFWLIFCTWIRIRKTGFELENYFIPRPGYNINVWSVELNEAKKGDRGATGDWKTDEGTRIWKHSIIILAFIHKTGLLNYLDYKRAMLVQNIVFKRLSRPDFFLKKFLTLLSLNLP